MRRVLLGLTLLFVAPGAVEARRQPLTLPTPPKPAPPVPVSSAAPADSLRAGTLYYVSGGELVPCDVHVEAVEPNSAFELQGETGALTTLEAQPHFRMVESKDVHELRLAVLEVKDGKRRARTDAKKGFKKTVPLVAREVQDRIFDLAPEKPLAPGEYAIGSSTRFQAPMSPQEEPFLVDMVMIRADFSIRAPATPTTAP